MWPVRATAAPEWPDCEGGSCAEATRRLSNGRSTLVASCRRSACSCAGNTARTTPTRRCSGYIYTKKKLQTFHFSLQFLRAKRMHSVYWPMRIPGAVRLENSWILYRGSRSVRRSTRPSWSRTTCPVGRQWSWPSDMPGSCCASWPRTDSDAAPLPILTIFCNHNLRTVFLFPLSIYISFFFCACA